MLRLNVDVLSKKSLQSSFLIANLIAAISICPEIANFICLIFAKNVALMM
jgi:hypothetical protein